MKIFTLPLLRGLYLPEQRDFLNPLELHGEAAKPMQQIYKSIIRLAVIGDDERRSIWLRFQSDYNGVQWGYMHITTYREYHYLYIGAKYTRFASCKWRVDSEENMDESANDFFGYTKAYQKFADKVLPIIDSIYANPEAYNAYINRYVPYALREGKIHRSILNQIVPEFKLGLKNAAKTIEALQRSIAEDYPTFDTMTIRTFCQYFRAADEQFHHITHDSGQTDVEYYQKHKWPTWTSLIWIAKPILRSLRLTIMENWVCRVVMYMPTSGTMTSGKLASDLGITITSFVYWK